jgi:hypothetical protein
MARRPNTEAAQQGVAGADRPIPHFEVIQAAFGHHDLRGAKAQIGGAGARANADLASVAYTSGDRIGFRSEPGVELAAHEAAHVVQQRAGVQIPGGVGQRDDGYERQADDAAAAVVRGESAESILDRNVAGGSNGTPLANGPVVQRQADKDAYKTGAEGWAGLVQATVEELDKRESHYFTSAPKYGDADVSELLRLLQIVLMHNWLEIWALALQQREGPFGNYLVHFYFVLANDDEKFALHFARWVQDFGIVFSLTSGHFQSLDYLDPSVAAPLNPAIKNLPLSRSVDNFTTATYDLSYKPSKPGSLSTTLRLTYADGTTIDVSLWDISDNTDLAWANAIGQGYVGPGGRVFPSRMSRNTVPRLWLEKQKAVAKINESNEDFEFFVSLGVTAVFSNLPAGPVVGIDPTPVDPAAPRAPRTPSDPPVPAEAPRPVESGASESKVTPKTPPPAPRVLTNATTTEIEALKKDGFVFERNSPDGRTTTYRNPSTGQRAEIQLRQGGPRWISQSWGRARVEAELRNRGFVLSRPTRGEGGLIYQNAQTGEEIRIMPKPSEQYRGEAIEKHLNSSYYRYRTGPDQEWGEATTILDKQ